MRVQFKSGYYSRAGTNHACMVYVSKCTHALLFITDKQQEVDITTFRAAQSELRKDAAGTSLASPNKSKSTVSTISESNEPIAEDASEKMSQISGYKRSLSHANSLPPGEVNVPKFGVSTDKEEELSEVRKIIKISVILRKCDLYSTKYKKYLVCNGGKEASTPLFVIRK